MMDFFWQGLLHPLLMPSHLILLIALGLLAAQQGAAHVKTLLPVFIVAIICGVGLTLVTHPRINFDSWLLVSALLTGLLVVLRLKLPVWPLAVLALVAALLIGLDSAAPRIPGMRGMKVQALLGGTALSAVLVVLTVSVPGLLLRRVLEGIPLRVLGAWITAGAALVLALKMSNMNF